MINAYVVKKCFYVKLTGSRQFWRSGSDWLCTQSVQLIASAGARITIVGIRRITALLEEKRIMRPVSTTATKNVPMFFARKSRSPAGGEINLLLKNTRNNQLAKNRRVFSALFGGSPSFL